MFWLIKGSIAENLVSKDQETKRKDGTNVVPVFQTYRTTEKANLSLLSKLENTCLKKNTAERLSKQGWHTLLSLLVQENYMLRKAASKFLKRKQCIWRRWELKRQFICKNCSSSFACSKALIRISGRFPFGQGSHSTFTTTEGGHPDRMQSLLNSFKKIISTWNPILRPKWALNSPENHQMEDQNRKVVPSNF